MIRALLRVVVVLALLAVAGGYLLGYRYENGRILRPDGAPAAALPEVEASRAREKGAEIGQRVAEGGRQAQRALGDAALTGKIKSKMTLDDTLDGSDINVATSEGVVTITGTVRSEAQRKRAVQLARETRGVKSVSDRLDIR